MHVAPGEDTQLQPLPPGLILTEDFVSEDYEATLLAAIDFDDVSPGGRFLHSDHCIFVV